jgi:hypothetical protein
MDDMCIVFAFTDFLISYKFFYVIKQYILDVIKYDIRVLYVI